MYGRLVMGVLRDLDKATFHLRDLVISEVSVDFIIMFHQPLIGTNDIYNVKNLELRSQWHAIKNFPALKAFDPSIGPFGAGSKINVPVHAPLVVTQQIWFDLVKRFRR